MRRLFLLVILAAASMIAVSCGSTSGLTRGSLYPQFYEEKPVTLLIMPPINNTTNVEAKEYLYTSISRPLAEAGYYVISPLLAMEVFKAESAYDAELFVNGPFDKFREYFGADAIVFSEINSWTKAGFGINTNIRYFIKSTRTGEIIFDRTCDLFLDLSIDNNANNKNQSTLGALLSLAANVINTATTDHIVAARKANYYIFDDIPRGKYSPWHMEDINVPASKPNVSASVK